MNHYIDGFVFPIPKEHIEEYKQIAEKVAEIWKDHGAISYQEYVGDDLLLEGTRSFFNSTEIRENELIIFGWVVFASKEIRDKANEKVPNDPRIADLVAPLIDPDRMIFDASRMVYGGFRELVNRG